MTRARALGLLSRVHAVLGVVPLGAFLLYHLWQQWPALDGREYWVDRARVAPSVGFQIGLVLVPLALHAVLGLLRLWGPPVAVPGPNGSQAMRRIQALTGLLSLCFIAYHLAHVWAWDHGAHHSPRQAYDALRHQLGQPPLLALYLGGLAVVLFHLGHGLPRAAVTLGLLRGPAAFRRTRYVAFAVVAVVWLGYLNVVSHFAVGQQLVPVTTDDAAGGLLED